MSNILTETQSRRDKLVLSTRSFISDIAGKKPTETLVSHFSTKFQVSIHEHGDRELAPFLGRTYHSPAEYINLIGTLLDHEEMKFTQDLIVDASSSKVVVKGNATWIWKETMRRWNEEFVYILDYDDEGTITDWNIWADTGAAYLAGPRKTH